MSVYSLNKWQTVSLKENKKLGVISSLRREVIRRKNKINNRVMLLRTKKEWGGVWGGKKRDIFKNKKAITEA